MEVYPMLEKLKNNAVAIIALVCAVASLIVCLTGTPETVDYTQQIEALEEQNAELQIQLDAMEAKLADATYIEGLADWDLTANVWEDSTGADAAFTAHPESWREGDSATLMVYLNGEVAANLPCAWDGAAYTATAQLPAANGYSFVCVLNGEQIPLASPDSPLVPELVYLADSLNAYCTLTLGEWTHSAETLDVGGINVSIHLPQLATAAAETTIASASLALYRNDGQIDLQALTLVPGEGSGSYVTDELDMSFALAGLLDGDMVELWLDVTLSGGELLRSCGGSWSYENGQLQLTAG